MSGKSVKSPRSGDGVFGMFGGGCDELRDMRLGGETGLRSRMLSSGGVSSAAGKREEMPKVLKDGSWRFPRVFTCCGSVCLASASSTGAPRLFETAARSLCEGPFRSYISWLLALVALQLGISESEYPLFVGHSFNRIGSEKGSMFWNGINGRADGVVIIFGASSCRLLEVLFILGPANMQAISAS